MTNAHTLNVRNETKKRVNTFKYEVGLKSADEVINFLLEEYLDKIFGNIEKDLKDINKTLGTTEETNKKK